jgi:hypothetical protein
VFRLCFGTSSEHLGQAGCFRLPIKACRPQPSLCVPESFNSRSKFSSRSPRTGQGKFKFKPGKERDCFAAASVPVSGIKPRKTGKDAQRAWGPERCPRPSPVCCLGQCCSHSDPLIGASHLRPPLVTPTVYHPIKGGTRDGERHGIHNAFHLPPLDLGVDVLDAGLETDLASCPGESAVVNVVSAEGLCFPQQRSQLLPRFSVKP